MGALLDARGLRVEYETSEGVGAALSGVDLTVDEGQLLGVVGESGSGKSSVAMALVNLVPRPGRIASGSVRYRDLDLLQQSERTLQKIRGREIGLVVQNAKSALNPLITIGRQLVNVIRSHGEVDNRAAAEKAVLMLKKVGIPDPETRMHSFPHQLSGGMAQRVTIAMALSNNPRLLIADEPTSGLDVTIQAQILDLIKGLVDELHSATILITRDLGIIAQYCEEVAVLYAGRIVERAPVRTFFRAPVHPYSEALLSAVSSNRQRARRSMPEVSPSIYDLPGGCPLHPRCSLARPVCGEKVPEMVERSPGHFVRCHVRQSGGIG